MSLMLAPDQVTLYPAAGADAHGWALPADGDEQGPAWEGLGNLQPQPGRSDPHAADGGGHGPFDPAWGATAVLFLPPEAPLAEGMVAHIQGQVWALGQVRLARDPVDDSLTCWACSATGVGTWPQGGTGDGAEPDD